MDISATAKSPCMGCTDRCIGCHTTCGDYKIYKQQLETNRAKSKAESDESAFVYASKKALIAQTKRHKKG